MFGSGEQQGSNGWDYHGISDQDDDMVVYNSDDEHVERIAFRDLPVFDPTQSSEKRWMLKRGFEEETKKKVVEQRKSPAEERIETVKFVETTSGVKRTREMTGVYEETTSHANTVKKFTINARMSIRPQEDWTGGLFTDSIRTTTTSTMEERLAELEVYKKCSLVQTEIFR